MRSRGPWCLSGCQLANSGMSSRALMVERNQAVTVSWVAAAEAADTAIELKV
jgi:hypothetical protein